MSSSNPSISRALQLKVIDRPPEQLVPAERNARIHTDRQIAGIMASINQFGFTNPVLLDGEGRIVAGHGRVEAAKRLKLEVVPTIVLDHLTGPELRAYALADNKLAENAGWDGELLRLELGELLDLDLKFDVEITGFSTGELDVLIDGPSAKAAALEATPAKAKATASVERGDLWRLGGHKLFCGDARDPASFTKLMGDDQARMVFSDPPYNVKVDGHVCGLGAIKHAEFAMASGEMTEAEFTEFLAVAFRNAADVSLDGAIHFQCMDWRHSPEMLAAGRQVYSELKNICVWAKDNGGMGAFYRSQHELVFVWKVGSGAHLNNVELGKHRYRTNVWNYRGARKTGPASELALHPTVKPVPMIIDAIKDVSRRGEIVLDPFGGSGSTLIAAEKAKRQACLIEYEPTYCEVTIQRFETLTKREAILEATGETFSEVKARRLAVMDALADAALGLEAA
jgi:DNA modification methylase